MVLTLDSQLVVTTMLGQGVLARVGRLARAMSDQGVLSERDTLIVLHKVRAMAEVTQVGMSQAALEALGVIWPPTEDELPY